MALVVKISLILLSIIALSEAAECPPLWSFFMGSCYRFFGPKKTWQEAEDHCQQFFTSNGQGHLASIHQSGTNKLLIELWKTSLSSHGENYAMWIGLTDQDVEGQFTWTDGTDYNFQAWLPGQPNNNNNGLSQGCVEVWYHEDNTAWNDRECTKEYSFACKMSVGY